MKILKNIMIVIMASMVCALGFVSCSDDDDNNKKSEITSVTLKALHDDYNKMIKQYPEFDGYFVEAQYTLNDIISETPLSELKATEVKYLFYRFYEGEMFPTKLLSMERDFETGEVSEPELKEAPSPWLGDKHISSVDGYISLEKALEVMKNSEYNQYAQTRYVTLRYPLLPNIDRGHALYVFGGSHDREYHLFVDGKTGELIADRSNI